MNEDPALNRLVKTALEAKGAFRPPAVCVHSSRWILAWSVPTLLAASLALVVAMRTFTSPRTDELAEAIALLSAVDGLELEMQTSTEEFLLTWQDAPTGFETDQTAVY